MNKTTNLDETNHGFPPNKYNPHAWLRGNPEIGEGTWIGPFTIIDAQYAKLTIGKGCNVAAGAKIMSHSTVRRCISEGEINVVDKADTQIGEYCFIGTNAVVLMGAEIGDHSIIGAGCVVTEYMKIPPYSLVVGIPAKIIGSSKQVLKEKSK